MNVFNENPKPIFLIGMPVVEFADETELEKHNAEVLKQKESLQERMPDYHVISYTCEKVEQVTFTILSHDGKQSNI